MTFTPQLSLKNIQAILSSGQDKTVEKFSEKPSENKYGFTRGAEVMLTETTVTKLQVAKAFKEQLSDPAMVSLSFEDRFGLIVDQE